MLYQDLYYRISLYCKPYLFSVCKKLHSIYDDHWYKTFLENRYPNKKLFTSTNYLDLYKKSLLEGDIYYVSHDSICKLQTRGIKAQYLNKRFDYHWKPDDYILTFNGDLYYQEDDVTTLIDNEVIDITSWGYIKKNKAYFEMTNGTVKELFFVKNLLRIVGNFNEIYILSINGVYVEDDQGLHFYEIKDCIDMIKLDKIYVIDKNNVYHAFINGKFEIYFPDGEYSGSENMKYLFIGDGHISLSYGTVLLYREKENIEVIDINVKNIIVDDEYNVNWYYIK